MRQNSLHGKGPRWMAVPLLVWGLLISARHTPAQSTGGLSPDQAAARMVLPEGFHAEVVASEPMVRQPVAACFDERGRLWVIEYLQYPNPAGLKPVSVDQYLRTEYDRFPEPPPRGPRGADRIKVLEDTDGDGRADKATVFVDGLNLASAIAIGRGGVFVGQAPYLLFYPDRNRDDRPDGDPEVLLTGFGLQDAHATVNSLAWGPDGWLYGAQGSTVTARIQGHEFQQAIWRYDPRTKRFEVFAEGGGNTWGLDFDAQGNAFGSSNGGYITFHNVQGGYYLKGFAKHGPLHNPHTYGYFGPITYEGNKQGGHVTPGGIIYQGDAYPARFWGTFIGGNLLSNAVYWHALKPAGSTFRGRHGGTLIDARDPWFRPIDLLQGPDAAVYVVDWYDKRAAHLDPRDTWDRTNGRIYRVVHGQRRLVPPFDIATKPSSELVALRTSGNDWFAREARRILSERRDASVLPALRSLLREDPDPTLALRDLWALHVSGGLDDATALELLDHPVPGVRAWTVRLLGDDHRMNGAFRQRLVSLAAREPEATVRAQLASSCQRWRAADALPILDRLLDHPEDRDDEHIPLLLWWAIERQMHEDQPGVVRLIGSQAAQKRPLVREVILERAARLLASQGSAQDLDACARMLAESPAVDARDRLLGGMEKGLEGRRLNQVPAPLEAPLARLWASSGSRPPTVLIRLALRLGYPPALVEAQKLCFDKAASEGDRAALIELLGQVAAPSSRSLLLEILDHDPSASIRLAAVTALGGDARRDTAEALLARYPAATAAIRERMLGLLCSRREWTEALVEAISSKRMSARDLSLSHVQQVVRLGDPGLLNRLESLWGRLPRSGSPEKQKRIAEVRGLLPEGDKGNAARGKPIFQEQCAVCHRLFGQGETIGPELTGADRGNLDFLLTSLVDPSASIRKEYQSQTLGLADGRILDGLVVEENDQTVTLINVNRQRTTVPRSQVEEQKPSDVSLMPEGLLEKLSEPQIRDLFRYLQSAGGS
jgi:putative membrane-bound dehydrogenase-like protein